ncbi:hypothetical protein HS088_TW12G00878 [Tripterygium wilfordii]|uniref:Uncharacterized protein n=1 Tax=Tripterygium wilfordii TaxID=458696 RepID=A0A7J7D0A4_TRIWF|nr:uncharacterized protein LOC120010559 [Tripterygium wilfordii]KAF5739669.1 hypothetical protein HS088_TW12G00878 [Tripterygium wilfordii]
MELALSLKLSKEVLIVVTWCLETYDRLDKTLAGTDHSWRALTLKLCSALETANKLVRSTNVNVRLLSENVEELEGIVKREDSALSSSKAFHLSLEPK